MQKPTAALLTVITIFSRLLPHPANFTTVGATSLFAGGKLSRPWNYILPLGALLVTDFIIGFHGTMPYVYVSVAAVILVGESSLKKSPTTGRIATVALLSSALFFLVTNFGVWASTGLYPHTAAGLVESYVMGLPFWRNMLAADLLFSLGFFQLYRYAETKNVIGVLDNKARYYITGK